MTKKKLEVINFVKTQVNLDLDPFVTEKLRNKRNAIDLNWTLMNSEQKNTMYRLVGHFKNYLSLEKNGHDFMLLKFTNKEEE